MLAILASWVIISLVFLAFGNISIALYNKVIGKKINLSHADTFWLGLCACGTSICTLSLFLPLNLYILSVYIVFTIIYWIIERKFLFDIYKSTLSWINSLNWLYKMGIALIFAIVIVYSLSVPYTKLYDEWLYHLQTIMWNEQYRAVPGLGNLHGRFAFNSNFLLLTGFFGYHPGLFPSLFSLTGLCLLLTCFWLIDWLNKMKNAIISSVVLLTALFFLIFFLRNTFSSTMTDPLPAIFVIYILISFVRYNISIGKLLVWTVMAAFCITLKTSTFAILLIPIFAFIYMLRNREMKLILFIFSFCLIMAIVWCTRSVILSGYLVYPFSAVDLFNFDWKVPKVSAIIEQEWVYSWARIASMDRNIVLAMPLNQWVPQWAVRQEKSTLILYFLVIISPIIILFRRKSFKNKPAVLFAWFVAMAGTLFGFFTAPDIRFNIGFVLCSAIIPFLPSMQSALFTNLAIIRKPEYYYSAIIGLSGIILLGLGVRQLIHFKWEDERLLTFILQPQTSDKVRNKLDIKFNETVINGIRIYTPQKGDQCYDHSIPCTPAINTSLQMKGNGFKDGFRIKKDGFKPEI